MPAPLPLDFPIYFEGEEGTPNPPEGGARIGSGLTDTLGYPLPAKLDHCAEGLSHLLHELQGKPRLEAFICVFVDRIQEVENTYRDLWILRTLDQAEGAQLNGLGAIVGEARQDRTDSVYRRFIRVRILVNRSNGKLEELYTIALQALESGLVRIHEAYPAGVVVHVDSPLGDLTPEGLFDILHQSKGGAVRLFLVYTLSDTDATFTWSDSADYPEEDNGTGWGSTTDGTWGGDWASIIG